MLITAGRSKVLIPGSAFYLLFAEPPWDALAPLWDITAWLDVALPDLRARLIQRWLDRGLSRAVATRAVGANDVPDTRLAIEGALRAELILATPPPSPTPGLHSGSLTGPATVRHR